MSSNITPGRLRDRIQVLEVPQGSDKWGVPNVATELIKLKGNVIVKSGDQLSKYGTEVTSEVITILTYYRSVVTSGQLLKWTNRGSDKVYKITHVKPADNEFKSMIITAELEKHDSNDQ